MNRVPGYESNDARWQAQERRLAGAPPDAGDALLAQALRTLPSSSPPAVFAAGVARVAMQARNAESDSYRGEQILIRVLIAAMAIGATVCAFVYSSTWAVTIASTLGDGALRWGLAGAACVAISALPWRHALTSAARSPASG